MREDRQLLGSSTNVSDMWSYAVLRQLTESTRQQTRACQWTSGDRVGAAGRALVVLLSRRGLRGVLSQVELESDDGEMPDEHQLGFIDSSEVNKKGEKWNTRLKYVTCPWN